MRTACLLLAALLVPTGALAQATRPGDIDAGKALHDKDCAACHARQLQGDGDRMYTRPDHKVTSLAKLRAQVAFCSTQLGKSYFPDEEEQLVAYLNARYYHFPP